MRFIAILLCCLLLTGFAMAEGKISAELQKKMALHRDSTEKIPVVVLYQGLPSFAEISKEYRFLGSDEIIREQVIRVMKEKAESLHYWLRQACETRALAEQVSDFQSIWIVNAVSLKATPYAIREIASQPNVEEILLDEPVPMLLDAKAGVAWGVKKIKADLVWKYFEGKDITVAVIDTGVNEHKDLKGRVIDGKNYIKPGTAPRDDHGHGTHCAGTVAGDGAAGTKTGVAPKATIMAIKVLAANGSGAWSNLWLGMEDTIGSKAKVLSMSLGGNADASTRQRLQQACKNTIAAGIIPVIAAGNSGPSGRTVGSPGDVLEVITIGATDEYDELADFSSRGPVKWDKDHVKPDVVAPGVDVKSCSHSSTSGYTTMSGTSMATPHVAGVVALMANAKPSINTVQAKQILETTAVKVSRKDNSYGSGRVNAEAAVKASQALAEGSREKWEMVVKELSFPTTVDQNGNLYIKKTISNDVLPGVVTIWVNVPEPEGRKGIYHVKFTMTGPDKVVSGTVQADFDNLPTDPNKYNPEYGFNTGNFEMGSGDHTGEVQSLSPNLKVKGLTVTILGKATWPARSRD